MEKCPSLTVVQNKEGQVRLCQLAVSHIMVLANTLTSLISLSSLPFPHYCIRLSCRNFSLPLPISFFPHWHFAVLCVMLDIRKHALKTQKKSLTIISVWHNIHEEQCQRGTPAEFCKTLVFQFISNSNSLKHSCTETKYCEFIPAVGSTIRCIFGACWVSPREVCESQAETYWGRYSVGAYRTYAVCLVPRD